MARRSAGGSDNGLPELHVHGQVTGYPLIRNRALASGGGSYGERELSVAVTVTWEVPNTVPVQLDRTRRPARQAVLEPRIHRCLDRVSRRGPHSGVQLRMDGLELVPDLLTWWAQLGSNQ